MTERLGGLGPAERELLLACGRVELDSRAEARARGLIEGGLDWPQLVRYARLHSVAPLLYHHLKRLGAERAVPEDAWGRLLQLYHRAAYQNRLYARENAALLEAFDRAGIRTLVPKGMSILEHVYQDLALRPLIDLMFLIPESAEGETHRLLTERGYARDRPRPVHGIYRWCCPELIYKTRSEMHFAVLLVWSLVNWPRPHGLSIGPVWERARPARVSGRATRVLSPEDLILYLCLQADNHGFFNRIGVDRSDPRDLLFSEWTNNRLVRFTDLHGAVRHHEGDLRWDRFLELARTTGLERAAYASLSLTDRLFGAGLEEALLRELRPGPAGRGPRRWLLEGVLASIEAPGSAGLPVRMGRWWQGLRPRSQILFGRLLGWFEFVFPGRIALSRRYALEDGAWGVPWYAAHALLSMARSAVSWLGAWSVHLTRWVRSAGRGPKVERAREARGG